MKKTLLVLNHLKKAEFIEDYAIGGGIAAIFYIEPILTYDLDIFIILPQAKDKKIIDLTPLFEELNKKGYEWKGEHIIIEGTPVQFIPADELETEAIHNAQDIDYEGIKTKLFSAEHLIAILIRAGRTKDIEKVEKILEQSTIDHNKLETILVKHKLLSKFKQRFGNQTNEKK
ncbi:MAG: hypothetical protein WBB67_06525 [bacterium]